MGGLDWKPGDRIVALRGRVPEQYLLPRGARAGGRRVRRNALGAVLRRHHAAHAAGGRLDGELHQRLRAAAGGDGAISARARRPVLRRWHAKRRRAAIRRRQDSARHVRRARLQVAAVAERADSCTSARRCASGSAGRDRLAQPPRLAQRRQPASRRAGVCGAAEKYEGGMLAVLCCTRWTRHRR